MTFEFRSPECLIWFFRYTSITERGYFALFYSNSITEPRQPEHGPVDTEGLRDDPLGGTHVDTVTRWHDLATSSKSSLTPAALCQRPGESAW